MATSAFKSTTKRTPIGAKSSSDDSPSSSVKPFRRSRSLSQAPAPRGKFVNTIRGSGFPEISLDDLAVDIFLQDLDNDEVEEDTRLTRRVDRRSSGISVVSDRERRGRSVCRQSGRESEGKSGVYEVSNEANLRRRRSVSVARDSLSDVNLNSRRRSVSVARDSLSDVNARRRRSVSVARGRISGSEIDIPQSQKISNRANTKPIGNGRISNPQKPASDRRLVRSYSQTDLLRSHDGYSSHSSSLTDDEAKDAHYGKNEVEKTIRAVYAQKAEHPVGEVVHGELYQAMRKELRYAVEEIRTELEQVMVKGSSTLDCADSLNSSEADLQAVSAITRNYASKLEQSEKRKQELLAEMLLEEQRGKELSKIVKELLPQPRNNAIEQKPLRTRKRSSDKNRMSRRLTEEAEKYFEDFISNVEDTDISSIDGERSDASSSLGGMSKQREYAPHFVEKLEGNQGRAGYNSQSVAMDGVKLPWLQWETCNDGSPLPNKSKTELPVTPKTLLWDAAQDSNGHPSSRQESCSPGLVSHSINSRLDVQSNSKEVEKLQQSRFDMDGYLELQRNEELLFERWRQRDRISSGCLLLCGNHIRF
ncbi:Major capsid [Heracleum sosnowskyi]|uniref:Major capsid n=1 Tax=Heracleum sosnowskyi TaxID=360622 RepID=A0AAD8MLZ0_9APIA|nr:Major capsid [Heracleum sosnowskyi]